MKNVRTNRIRVTFKFPNILRDFDIFCISPKTGDGKGFYQDVDHYCILDAPHHDYHALSCVYGNGQRTFALFRKGEVNIKEFQSWIQGIAPGFESSLPLTERDFKDTYFFGEHGRFLAQLLLNTIQAAASGEKRYYNTSSWLLQLHKTKKEGKRLVFYQFHITDDMILRLSIRTFSWFDKEHASAKDNKKPRFYWHNGVFRRLLKSDQPKPEEIYILKGDPFDKNTEKFLRITTASSLATSRGGALMRFFHRANTELKDYLHMEQEILPSGTVIAEKSIPDIGARLRKICTYFDDCPIYIKNMVGVLGKPFAEKLRKGFQSANIHADVLDEEPTKDAFCVYILHEPTWYKKHKQDDPYHMLHHASCIPQVVTVDDDDDADIPNGMIYTICKELVIKRDIRRQKVSLPTQIGKLHCPWTFAIERKVVSVDNHGDEVKTPHWFTLTLSPDGTMDFHTFSVLEGLQDPALQKIMALFSKKDESTFLKSDETVSCVLYSDPENMHVILRTYEWVLPDIEALFSTLRDMEEHDVLRSELASELEAFRNSHTKVLSEEEFAKRKTLLESLKLEGDKLKKNDISKILPKKSKWGDEFQRYWLKYHGFPIVGRFRSFDHPELMPLDYDLDTMKSIHAIRHMRNGVPAVGYFSGAGKSLNQRIANGILIYDLLNESPESPLQLDEILPLLDVDFVRSSDMYSVLPFPIKYLREFADAWVLLNG